MTVTVMNFSSAQDDRLTAGDREKVVLGEDMAMNNRTTVTEAAEGFQGKLASWTEGQEETGLDQEVQRKQLEGSLHNICTMVPDIQVYP